MVRRIAPLTLAVCALGLLAACAFVPRIGPAAPEVEVSWEHWSSDVFERARHERKAVLVLASADWCDTCEWMQLSTFRDETVIAAISKHFIPVHVDVDKQKVLAYRLGIESLPTSVVLDTHGDVVRSLNAYQTASSYIDFLRAARARIR